MLKKPKTCITSTCFELSEESNRYVQCAKNLISSNLKYTDFDIFLLTNKKEDFNDINHARVKIINYFDFFNEPIVSGKRFNMHLKRYSLKLCIDYGYDIIYYNDCDCFIDGWDDYSFQNKIKEDFDVFFLSHPEPQLGSLRRQYKHFQEIIDAELCGLYTEDMDLAPNPAETRVIFKNNEKLSSFLFFWDKISNNNKDYFTYHDGIYLGTSAIYAKMKMGSVVRNDVFSKHCFIHHADGILDHFGIRANLNEIKKEKINQIEE